jgi:hypothetical protein
MDAKLRMQALDKIKTETKEKGSKRIKYNQETKDYPVFEIPTKFLVYNVLNHRIASQMETYKREKGEILPETEEGKKIIEDMLFATDEPRNKATMKSLANDKQMVTGVVTRDGIIADGNRRCMLLNRNAESSGHEATFLAVILDERLEDNPKSIMALETYLQLGQDEKLEYNSIQRYIQVHNLLKEGFSEEEVADMMNTTVTHIRKNNQIFDMMEQCLESWDAKGLFQLLVEKKLDGNFNDLQPNLKRLESRGKYSREINDEDINVYKKIHWDFYRLGDDIGSAVLRPLADTNPNNPGLFSAEKIWNDFAVKHFSLTDGLIERPIEEIASEKPDGTSLVDIFAIRDTHYKNAIGDKIKENFYYQRDKRKNLSEEDQPLKLLKAALDKVETVEEALEKFEYYDPEVLSLTKDIERLCRKIETKFPKR